MSLYEDNFGCRLIPCPFLGNHKVGHLKKGYAASLQVGPAAKVRHRFIDHLEKALLSADDAAHRAAVPCYSG